MAGTMSKKRVRKTKGLVESTAPRRSGPKEPKVGEMTRAELRALIEEVLDERTIDPDAGLELRPEILVELREQDARVAAGERGQPLADVMKELGLE